MIGSIVLSVSAAVHGKTETQSHLSAPPCPHYLLMLPLEYLEAALGLGLDCGVVLSWVT